MKERVLVDRKLAKSCGQVDELLAASIRVAASAAIGRLLQEGIRIVTLTGDSPTTAQPLRASWASAR